MSKAVKRKADEKPAESWSIVCSDSNICDIDVDAELDKAIAKVKEGTHSHLLARARVLDVEKDKQIQAAERHRKLQFHNINQLYEYEVEDAQALYNKSFAELQDQLVLELTQEKQRLKALQKQAKAIAESSDDPKPVNRSLRSQGTAATAAASASPSLGDADSSTTGSGKEGVKDKRRKIPSGAHPCSMLEQVLPESMMRSDFLEIVRDLKAQAALYERSKPQPLNHHITVGADNADITISDVLYSLGEGVALFSVLSQETFHGVLTSISDSEIVVRTYAGPRLSFTISQLSAGRVNMSKYHGPLAAELDA